MGTPGLELHLHDRLGRYDGKDALMASTQSGPDLGYHKINWKIHCSARMEIYPCWCCEPLLVFALDGKKIDTINCVVVSCLKGKCGILVCVSSKYSLN